MDKVKLELGKKKATLLVTVLEEWLGENRGIERKDYVETAEEINDYIKRRIGEEYWKEEWRKKEDSE